MRNSATYFLGALPLTFIACALTITGCQSDSPSGIKASGQVRVQGEPLSGAVITLEPVQGTTGPALSTPVFGGRFEFTADAGLHGGTYQVRISMVPAELRKNIPESPEYQLPPADAVIDPQYDAQSDITWDLKAGQTNTSEFDVEFR